MLPSRSRLERWNPDSLTFTGQAIKDAGAAVENAVRGINDNIKIMPETKAWSGDAHTAATSMFDRAEKQTKALTDYTTAVGDAFAGGASTIGGARTALLNKTDEIDTNCRLHVSEQWVVLITGAQMTTEESAALERRAQAEQVIVNGLLLAVGSADGGTAAKVTGAAQPHGFEAPNPADPGSLIVPGMQRPGDEVPNPSNPVGFLQQAMLRDTDMAETIRDETVETRYDPATGEELSTTTTLYMQDGSKHVKTVNAKPLFSDRGPGITETHFDKDGNIISETSSVTFNEFAQGSMANAKVTTVVLADRTVITLIERPGGSKSGTITTPGGQPADVPLELFNHPGFTAVGAGFSGLEAQAGRGIPMLTAEATEYARIGGKYGGPGIGIATALWDVAVADSGFQKCVAAAEGATSVAAGTLGGIAAGPTGPVGVAVASIAASGGGQALGNWIGNTFCPR